MTAFNQLQLKEDDSGFLECCDFCNRLIHNWNWMGWSFVTWDGRICCNFCRGELLKKEISND